MKTTILLGGLTYEANLEQPLDISIPLRTGEENVNAWYCEPVKIEPVVMGDWVGDVNRGGSVNFRNVFLNPHGNGTHTECVGHISSEPYSLNKELKTFFFVAELVSVKPEVIGNDQIIQRHQLQSVVKHKGTRALAIRTLPNEKEKMTRHYSNTNPPYLDHEAALWMAENGIEHLLLDLPSVDREKDDGKLKAHHAFWQYPHATRTGCTISELIYVPDQVRDGLYLLNLQITSLVNDASPSKPVLFELKRSGS